MSVASPPELDQETNPWTSAEIRFDEAAKRLRIELFYLPPYSPNLNLIERFWKFLKRKVARNRFHATFVEFRTAVQKVLNNIAAYSDELAALMTERFQLLTAS